MNAFRSLADAWAALAWAVTWQTAALGNLAEKRYRDLLSELPKKLQQ